MQPISIFSVQAHSGQYETWGLYSRLIMDGQPTDAQIQGYVLEAQYRTAHGYLLLTTWDCPYEEAVTMTYLDFALNVLDCRTLGWMYATGSLHSLEACSATTLEFSFFDSSQQDRWRLVVRERPSWWMRLLGRLRIPLVHPYLRLSKLW